MPAFQHRLLLIALTTAGITACGSDSDSSSGSANTGTDVSTTTRGTCTIPTVAAPTTDPAWGWDVNTGTYEPDQTDTRNWLPLNITLDTLSVSSTSPCFTVTRTSDTITTVSVQDEPAITLTRDARGLSIRSTTTAPVTYQLSGTGNTPVTLFSNADYGLKLENATLTSADGPALNLQSTRTAFVELAGRNTLRDSATWSPRTNEAGAALDQKATMFAEGPMVFQGTGSLQIDATPEHALASDAHIRVKSGTLALKAAAKGGIEATRAFIQDGGTVRIDTPAGKGIKVDGKEESQIQALGFIALNGGSLTVRSYDKGISAAWELDEDATTPIRDDDPNPQITINGGTLNVTTTGPVRNDSADPPGTKAPSPEGIEAKTYINVNDGNITLNTQDDSMNAGTAIEIKGGRIYAHSALNDSLDANGPITISGGLMVATSAAPHPESAFDADTSQPDTFKVLGGTFVGLGYHNNSPSLTGSTQNSVAVTNGRNLAVPAGLWTLRDATGKAVFAYDIPFAASYFTISSPLIADGGSYTVVTGGTLGPVGEDFHGMAVEPSTHTGGTAGTTFTVTQRLTRLGVPFQWPAGGPDAPVPTEPQGPPPALTPVIEGPVVETYGDI